MQSKENLLLRHIPNIITLANLFAGFFGVVAAFSGDLVLAAWMIIVAAAFDFCDGLAAKLLRAQSELGKQLDSLADLVSFGLLPATIAFWLLYRSHSNWLHEYYTGPVPTICLIAFFILAMSALRLAKFNIDTRQSNYFIGMPTPIHALLWASFPLIMQFDIFVIGSTTFRYSTFILDPWLLIGLIIFFSLLLVSELPLIALKFRNFKWIENKGRHLFLIISIVLLLWLYFLAIPIIIFLYLILSLIFNPQKNEIQS